MSNEQARILVVGATGELGGVVARKLLAAGYPVRAFGRNRTNLDALAALGAEVAAGNLLDAYAVERACVGVTQIITTANNVMGHGASSPNRVDLPAHRNLCDAALAQGVRRLVYVSALGTGGLDSPVDFFRLKVHVEALIQQSGVPYVMLRPPAFMETWVAMLIGDGIRDKGVALLFGDGKRISNFIAIDDVADFAVKVLEREEIQNEVVEIGGPSTISYADIATLVEQELGITAKRKNIPVPILRLGSAVLRPFNETVSRKMSLGYFAATRDAPFPEWRFSAERFGVAPMSVEMFVAKRYGKARNPAIA